MDIRELFLGDSHYMQEDSHKEFTIEMRRTQIRCYCTAFEHSGNIRRLEKETYL
ncbi:hypothetical protein pb186bvf_011776 [Paramecium bursaria]